MEGVRPGENLGDGEVGTRHDCFSLTLGRLCTDSP
jgi:hypothetical protein